MRLSASCNLKLTSHDGVKQLHLSDQDNALVKAKIAYNSSCREVKLE